MVQLRKRALALALCLALAANASANLCGCDVFLANATAETEAVCFGSFVGPFASGRWCAPLDPMSVEFPCSSHYLESLLSYGEFRFYVGHEEPNFETCYREAQGVPQCSCNSYSTLAASMARKTLLCTGRVVVVDRDDYDVCATPDDSFEATDPLFCSLPTMSAEADAGDPQVRLSVVFASNVFPCWQGGDEDIEDVRIYDPSDPALYTPFHPFQGEGSDPNGFGLSSSLTRWLVSRQLRVNPALSCPSMGTVDEPAVDNIYLMPSYPLTRDEDLWEPFIGNDWSRMPCDEETLGTCAAGRGVDMATHANKGCCSNCASPGETVYARSLMVLPSATSIDLNVGIADGVTIWINGVQVFQGTNCGCYEIGQASAVAAGVAGYNEILYKTSDVDGDQWGFFAGAPFAALLSTGVEVHYPEQVTSLTDHGDFDGPGIDFGTIVAWVVSRPLATSLPSCVFSGPLIVEEPSDALWLGNSTLFQEYYTFNGNETAPCSYANTCAPSDGIDLSAHYSGRCCDFDDATCTGGSAVAYARTYLYSPRDQSVTFSLKQSDAVMVWIEGSLRHSSPDGCHCITDAGAYTTFSTTLPYGWSEVVLKTANVEGVWAFKLAIATADAAHLISAHHAPFKTGEKAEPVFLYNRNLFVIDASAEPTFENYAFATGFNFGGEDVYFPGDMLIKSVDEPGLEASNLGVQVEVHGAVAYDYSDTYAFDSIVESEAVSTILRTGIESSALGETVTVILSGLVPDSIYQLALVFDEILITGVRGFSVAIQGLHEGYVIPYLAEWGYRGNATLGAPTALGGAGSVVDYTTMSDEFGEIEIKLGESFPLFLPDVDLVEGAFLSGLVIEGDAAPPTLAPSVIPSTVPSLEPSRVPSAEPSRSPSAEPSKEPSKEPSGSPSVKPSKEPSRVPSVAASDSPSGTPTDVPTVSPTMSPSTLPSTLPSTMPSAAPTSGPTSFPSLLPSDSPTFAPSDQPTAASCVDLVQSGSETDVDCGGPDCPGCALGQTCVVDDDCVSKLCLATVCMANPSAAPSSYPSRFPTESPSLGPTHLPTSAPTSHPTELPSATPTGKPFASPTESPTTPPSALPTELPTGVPSALASSPPTSPDSSEPSQVPTLLPSQTPSLEPSTKPSVLASQEPSQSPVVPSAMPTLATSSSPTTSPTSVPSAPPTIQPDVPVKAVISNLPGVLDTCQNITVDGSQSFGVALQFNWILLADRGDTFAEIQFGDGSSLFSVDASLLEENSGSLLRVYLSVLSSFNGETSSVTEEVFVSPKAVPLVTIDGGGFIEVSTADGLLRLTGRATLPACGDGAVEDTTNSTMVYAWSMRPSSDLPSLAGPDPMLTVNRPGVVADGPVLQVPSSYYSPGWVYEITLNATLRDSETNAILSETGIASTTLEMVRTPLSARVVEGQFIETPTLTTASLTCSGEDADYDTISVAYSWACFSSNTASPSSPLNAAASGAVLTINPSAEAAGRLYQCICTVSAGAGALPLPVPAQARTIIEVFEQTVVPAPEVSLVVIRNGILPEFETEGAIVLQGDWIAVIAFVVFEGQQVDGPTSDLGVEWSIESGGTTTLLPSTDFSVNFDPSNLNEGEIYFVSLAVTPLADGGLSRPGTARTRVRVNDGPTGGRVVFALSNAGLVEGTGASVSDPLATSIRVSVLDVEDPDGVEAFDFFLLGCDPNPDLTGDSPQPSGAVVGLSATLALGSKSNSLETFLPRPLSICPELLESSPDAVADWLVVGVTAFDGFGAASQFTSAIQVQRATPSPTASPTEALSLAPTVVGGTRAPTGPPVSAPTTPVDCKTQQAREFRAIGNAEGMLTYLWLLTLDLESTKDIDACSDELIELMYDALDIALSDSVEIGCQCLVVFINAVSDLDQPVVSLILDLLTDLVQDVSSGLGEEIDYNVLEILECTVTAVEGIDVFIADGSPDRARWVDLYTSAIDILGVQLLRQMTPGQDPFEVGGSSDEIGTTAYVEIASRTDGTTLNFSDAGVTLPPSISSAVEVVYGSCPADATASGVVDLGLVGATRRGVDEGFGRTLTLSMTTCGATENLLGSSAFAGLSLSLALDAGEVVQNTTLPIVDATGNSATESVDLTARITLSCESRNDAAPYDVTGLCPGGEAVTYTCDGVTAGSVEVTCPYDVIIGSCVRFDPALGSWVSDGCTFLGIEDSRALCDCQLPAESSTRRLQDDEESGSLDFGARFENIATEAEFTFTEADNVTADDAERAVVVLVALGAVLGTWLFMVWYGHKLDRRERDKTKFRRRNEDIQIRNTLARICRELKQPFVRERQREVLGEEKFTLLGSADGGVFDYVKTLCVALMRRVIGRRERSPSTQEREMAKAHSMRIRSDEGGSETNSGKGKKTRGYSSIFWRGNGSLPDPRGSDARPSDGGALYYDTETKIEASSDSNPMHHRAGFEQFVQQTTSRENASARARSWGRKISGLEDSFSDAEQVSTTSSFSLTNSVGPLAPSQGGRSKSSSQGMRVLFRMRNRGWRRASGSTEESVSYSDDSKVAGSSETGYVTNRSRGYNSVSDHLSELEELESIVDAMDAEIGEMQAVRKNFKTALSNEHEVIGLFRYNPTDITMDDFYNEQASAVQQSVREKAKPDLEVSLSDDKPQMTAADLRKSVAGRGVWSQAQLLWTSSTRPQKATFFLLEVLSIMTIDALFYTGSDDLIVSSSFWDDLADGQTEDLAKEGFNVVVFALITAILALPPAFLAYGAYRVRREMRAAEVIGRRVLLHSEDYQLNWELQLQPKNSAADYAIALLETLAILQLAQNMDDESVVPLRRHASALELLRNRMLLKEMNNAADVAAAKRSYEDGLGHRDSALSIMNNQTMWLKRRRAAAVARRNVARQHEEEVRDGLAVLMTEAECQRVRMEEAAARVLGLVEKAEASTDSDATTVLAVDFSLSSRSSDGFGDGGDGKQRKSLLSGLQPSLSQLYEDWVSVYSRPSVYQMARMYACPAAVHANGMQTKKAGGSGLAGMGKAKKKLVLAFLYAAQAMWGAFCVAYIVLFALTRSSVATAWFFSFIIATIFEIIYVSPIIILFARVLFPATVGQILMRGLDKAKIFLATGSESFRRAQQHVRTNWRAGNN